MSSPHHPERLIFENAETGERRTVRFGSVEHHELTAKRHPAIWHRPLWRQVHTPQPQEDANDNG